MRFESSPPKTIFSTVVFGCGDLMPKIPSKIYSQHVANLRELELAISHAGRLARAAIASRDPQGSLRSLLRLYSFLLGAWTETRLRKLLHEDPGFSEQERKSITSEATQLEQWIAAVNLSFRKHHKLPRATLDEKTLGVAHAARRTALLEVLNGDLRIVIEIRNKLAHGQWVYPFNNEGTTVEEEKYRLINKENLLSLELKYSIVEHLADTIHDLVVSPETFERDFEAHFRRLFQAKTNLGTRSYTKYEQGLIRSREKARAVRTSNG